MERELEVTEGMISHAYVEMMAERSSLLSNALDSYSMWTGQTSAQLRELYQQPSIPTEQPVNTGVRSRQADLVDSSIFENSISVVGAGAIGSFTVLTLAKMGFRRFTVYDHDIVSDENIANQFYRYADRGSMKVSALQRMIHDFEGITINTRAQRWDNTQRLEGYVVMAVDSMAVRNQIYQFIKRNSDVYGFVDGRMGGQQAELYSVDLLETSHRKIYEQYLWSDSEASELPCTQKAVMYNVLWIASQIANNLRLMMEDKPFPNVMLMDFENSNHMNVKHT